MHGSRTARIAAAVVFAAIAACSDDLTDPASINDFAATMNGASVRPTATSSGGTASATFAYNGTNVSFDVDYTGLSAAPSNAKVHLGGPTATGSAALNLCGAGAAPACPGTAAGTFTGAAADIASGTVATTVNAMRGFGAYVVINTASLTNGEVRGNIVGVY